MWVVFLLGFASGLPLALVGGTLKTWLKREGVDLTTIGFFSWVGATYSFKFLWAPFLDKYFHHSFGRRRTWMLASQIAMVIGIAAISRLNPHADLLAMGFVAAIIAFFSATQDIAIDAYRREILPDNELGIGSSLNVYGYRIAMLVSGGAAIGMVGLEGSSFFSNLTWNDVYLGLALIMSTGILITFLADEPKLKSEPTSFLDAVIHPMKELVTRPAWASVLIFVILFKLGDSISAAMLNPFYVDMGYDNLQIGAVVKAVGLFSSLTGLFAGGSLMYWVGIYPALWISGILQALSTVAFALLTMSPTIQALTGVVFFEDYASGMGTAAFVAFMGSITDKKYTAFQFALLTSLATVGRTLASGWSGAIAQNMGWLGFFVFCGAIATPGLVMLWRMKAVFNASKVQQ